MAVNKRASLKQEIREFRQLFANRIQYGGLEYTCREYGDMVHNEDYALLHLIDIFDTVCRAIETNLDKELTKAGR